MNRVLGKVIILLAHPNLEESRANRELVDTVKDMDNVFVYDLYGNDEWMFQADEWAQVLLDASALVFQFPFYWMSAPSMLKKWQEEVFTSLSRTPSVVGKPLQVVTTTGSHLNSYRSGGKNHFTVDELLRPYQACALHSGMKWQTPIVICGMGSEDPARNLVEGAQKYKERVEELQKNNPLNFCFDW